MNSLRVEEIIKSTTGKLVSGESDAQISKIVIDNRQADDKSLFIAIIGENNDGHNYIGLAYENGCRNFLLSDEKIDISNINDANIILVENTEIAMGMIAKYYRNKFDLKVVGITGSVGKTTTRDMVYAVISEKYKTLKNEKNFNNQFGVPLTLFNLDESYECAVIEMGMCGFGEIKYLVDIVKPDIGVISNIGMSHIELLGSQEGIFKAKMEITSDFDKNSRLIINGDDQLLSTILKKKEADEIEYKLYSFGKNLYNDLVLKSNQSMENKFTDFIVSIKSEDYKFTIPTIGEHNIYNAMAAIIVGLSLDMTISQIQDGLLNFQATENRQDIISTDKYIIINDVYNASPDSMIASLKVLSMYKEKRKIAILGDCLEMGDYAEEGHRKVGIQSIKKADLIITAGEASKYIGIEAQEHGFDLSNIYHFDTKEELINDLPSILKKDDVILVKASRGMHFEKIVTYLEGGK
ncbi:UDP-N-acetylmuramoyl-tripeptide--D-alanyl-D-alanine ligase [Peptostreptococcus equinus]|uniref:UDP-N-acetylmuramoyl-tripeptide--D-alanyl-D-alanine ligase n=1 Tax=Peptostreptococcus equinus TaxID=3003601 RepID=A0ABY7JQG3_9FIRM|nr:UDP-N-acetylmuramoyl-tripeptide--D-alanyl-D-alanine ligase [Peptostreptococcus sp. CBA3647]WAW15598.1 UDP-N-acetylmuramoyl-tripeptide--D-alanyl-D-alanine ligase [Peptostreptococcus sp. CBA3647]